MKKPILTTWESSKDIDIARVDLTFRKIFSTYYMNRQTPVVYASQERDKHNAVHIPQIDLEGVRHLRNKLHTINNHESSNEMAGEVKTYLENQMKDMLSDDELKAPIKDLWTKHQDEIIDTVRQIVPPAFDTLETINFHLTRYGTTGNFDIVKPNSKQTNIILRYDANLYNALFCVLSSLFRYNMLVRQQTLWAESQIVIDWLIDNTIIHDLLEKLGQDDYNPLLARTRSAYTPEILKESDAIYEALGMHITGSGFRLDHVDIYYNNELITGLSQTENKLLGFFISKQPDPITFDDIASVLNLGMESYSLYSISKHIQRLRERLDYLGIDRSHIQTVRGLGFRLV